MEGVRPTGNVCVLCCCDHEQMEATSGGEQGEDDVTVRKSRLEEMKLCVQCRAMMSKAIMSKMELVETEKDIRRRQLELLRELRKLEGLLNVFQNEMLQVSQVVQESNLKLVRGLERKELPEERNSELMRLRSKALTVVADLETFFQEVFDEKRKRRPTWVGEGSQPKLEGNGETPSVLPVAPVKREAEPSDRWSENDQSDLFDLYEDDDSSVTSSPEFKPEIVPDGEDEQDGNSKSSDNNAESFDEQDEDDEDDSVSDDPDYALLPTSPVSKPRKGKSRSSQKRAKYSQCDICGKPFKDHYQMKIHRWSHKNAAEKAEAERAHVPGKYGGERIVRTHTCPTCGKKFQGKKNLTKHERIHLKTHICSKCDQQFNFERSLIAHQRTCGLSKDELRHKCNLCDRSFSRKICLREHINIAHTKEEVFVCSICAKKFGGATSLRAHEATHSEGKFTCTMNCGKSLKTVASLKKHVAMCKGEGVRNKIPAECPVCKIIIKNKNMLNRHIKTRHFPDPKEPKVYLCTHCPKTFKQKHFLTEHLTAVSGERPHLCRKGCGAAFFRTTTRTRHEKSCSGSGTAHGKRPTYVTEPEAVEASSSTRYY